MLAQANSDINAGLAPSTWRHYKKHLHQYQAFLTSHFNKNWKKCFVYEFKTYLAYLRRHQKLKASTIKSTATAIGHFYKIKMLNNPATAYPILKQLAAYDKYAATEKRLPITKPILSNLLKLHGSSVLDPYYRAGFYCLYFMMYHMALRISEASHYSNSFNHAIFIEDIVFQRRVVCITLQSYKHGTTLTTYEILHTAFRKALKCFIKLRGMHSGPLFAHRNGLLFTRRFICKQLKHDLGLIGLQAENFNCHSFRIGKITDMALSGKSDRQLAIQGQWKSNAFLKYVKPQNITV